MITSMIGVVLSWCTLLPRGATIYTSLTTMLPVQQVDEVPVPVQYRSGPGPGPGTGAGAGTGAGTGAGAGPGTTGILWLEADGSIGA